MGQGSTVEQQAICHLRDELQREMALEARPYGRKPGVAVAMETVFGLLALGPLELRRALASREKITRRGTTQKNKKNFIFDLIYHTRVVRHNVPAEPGLARACFCMTGPKPHHDLTQLMETHTHTPSTDKIGLTFRIRTLY